MADLRFDQAIQGGSWLGRERDGDAGAFCWIGGTRRAWVEMVPDRRAETLVVEIPHVVAQEVLATLRISVDGEPVEHSLAEADGVVVATAPLPRSRLR